MAAAKLDIVLEEGSDLAFDFTYLDEDDVAVDVTGYGGTIVFAKNKESEPFIKGTDTDGWIQFGTTDGSIIVDVPYTQFQNLGSEKGLWQLYIYPTSGDITTNPKRLIEGEWVYSKSLL